MAINIPATLDEFTADWLTQAFEVEEKNYAPVVSVNAERIAVGE